MHGTSVQQQQYVIARRIQPDSKYTVFYDSMYECVRVYTSMYEYIQVYNSTYKYNQANIHDLHIFFLHFLLKNTTCCAEEMYQCIYKQ